MIAEQFDVFLFDLDGVIYVGDEPVQGANEALQRLRSTGRIIRFLTNDPRPDRDQLLQRLAGMDLEVSRSEIVNSGWVTAQQLAEQGVKSAFLVGSEGLHREFRSAGIRIVETKPEVVVAGPDANTTYRDLQTATQLLLDGARFVATNPDTLYPTPEGMAPASGALTRTIQAAVGRRPQYIGKPHAPMFEAALSTVPENPSAVMIGDNPHTDILGAHRYGIPAILLGEPNDPPSNYHRPDSVIGDLHDLFDERHTVPAWTSDGFPWPETVRTRIGAVVTANQGQRVWLSRSTGPSSHDFPTGRIRAGESIEHCLRRLLDNQGLEIEQVAGMVGIYSRPSSQVRVDQTGRPVQELELVFLIRTDTSFTGQGWHKPDDVAQMIPESRRGWLQDALDFSGHPAIR